MKRIIRILVAAALVASLIAASLFLILNADHECESECCQICLRLESAVEMLKNLIFIPVVLLCNSALFRLSKEGWGDVAQRWASCRSPILLRVKLNN